jgi:hypothetical protein
MSRALSIIRLKKIAVMLLQGDCFAVWRGLISHRRRDSQFQFQPSNITALRLKEREKNNVTLSTNVGKATMKENNREG